MTLGRVAALTGLALGVMAVNVAISILYMVVYGYVIDPGHDQAYYEAHVKIAAPYSSIVAGIPLMFLVGWWVGMRPAMVVWLVYALVRRRRSRRIRTDVEKRRFRCRRVAHPARLRLSGCARRQLAGLTRSGRRYYSPRRSSC